MTPSPHINHTISREITAFIIDRRAAGRSPNTIRFYSDELSWFQRWLKNQKIINTDQLTPAHIRQYLLELTHTRNNGGVHAAYRCIRAWLYWYAAEIEKPHYRKLIQKIKVAKPGDDPLPGISPADLRKMLAACQPDTCNHLRDKALLLMLYDTGLRAQECLDLNFGDIDLDTGAIQIRNGKGSKPRTVYLGGHAMKALIRYMRHLDNHADHNPIWLSLKGHTQGNRLSYSGLREILRRISALAGVPEPTAHDFRRAFCLQYLKNGGDIFTLQRLTGHRDLKTLSRYLALANADLQTAHRKASPADNL